MVLTFTFSLQHRVLLQGADLMLNYGHRYGLIGRNGVGKTTLLRSLSRYVRRYDKEFLLSHKIVRFV